MCQTVVRTATGAGGNPQVSQRADAESPGNINCLQQARLQAISTANIVADSAVLSIDFWLLPGRDGWRQAMPALTGAQAWL
jgi:hypothetical protein